VVRYAGRRLSTVQRTAVVYESLEELGTQVDVKFADQGRAKK